MRRFLGGGADPLRISRDDLFDGFATEGSHPVTPGELERASCEGILRVREAETAVSRMRAAYGVG